MSDSLDNVTGRAWLVAELDKIATTTRDLMAHYPQYRRGRTGDRREFVDSIERLKEEAFLTARAVRDGHCDIQHVISVFNWMARLDHAVHAPDIVKGRNKTVEEYAAGFGAKHDEHERWAQEFKAAQIELTAAGERRVGNKAATLAMSRLGIEMTTNGFLRAVRGFTPGQK